MACLLPFGHWKFVRHASARDTKVSDSVLRDSLGMVDRDDNKLFDILMILWEF